MVWTETTYEIRLDNGTVASVDGAGNGLFGVSRFDHVLTHLGTGYKIAQFRDTEAAQQAGDYLTARYAAEFNALNQALHCSTKHEDFKQLSIVRTLDQAVRSDDYFQLQIKEWTILPKKKND